MKIILLLVSVCMAGIMWQEPDGPYRCHPTAEIMMICFNVTQRRGGPRSYLKYRAKMVGYEKDVKCSFRGVVVVDEATKTCKRKYSEYKVIKGVVETVMVLQTTMRAELTCLTDDVSGPGKYIEWTVEIVEGEHKCDNWESSDQSPVHTFRSQQVQAM